MCLRCVPINLVCLFFFLEFKTSKTLTRINLGLSYKAIELDSVTQDANAHSRLYLLSLTNIILLYMVLPEMSSLIFGKTFQNELVCCKIAFVLDNSVICQCIGPVTHCHIVAFKGQYPFSACASKRKYCSLFCVGFF